MNLTLIADTWSELRRYIIGTDMADAADSVVGLLLDNNIDPADIREAFGDDADIRKSLGGYADDDLADEEEDYGYDDEDDDY